LNGANTSQRNLKHILKFKFKHSEKINMSTTSVRIDKWLWAARFFNTRSLASKAIDLGRVLLQEERVKAAHSVNIGDQLSISNADQTWEIIVLGLSENRGAAPVARLLYQETEASQQKRQEQSDRRKYAPEPAAQIKARPSKKDRRSLSNLKHQFELD
jgi:ribosome-associated heat shock protein Hsp15